MKRLIVEKCSGCKACENVCPRRCLSVSTERTDCFMLIRDMSKCNECGLCEMVCPQTHLPVMRTPIQGYNACSKDYLICKKSSSGGMASEIYAYSLKKGDKCIGVSFDENLHLMYRFINNVAEIPRFAGSKYVYSDMGDIYGKIRETVRSNRVVFVGLPCHVAGLNNYLIGNFGKLITIELMCDGLPMPAYFDGHVKTIEDKIGKKIANVQFREKANNYGFSAKDNKGKSIYREDPYIDEYMLAFVKKVSFCGACYQCPYATTKRCADITIMDCSLPQGEKSGITTWFNASQVMINSGKGILFWKEFTKEERIQYVNYPIAKMKQMEKRMNYSAHDGMGHYVLSKLYRLFSLESIIRGMFPITRLMKEVIRRDY